MLKRAFRKGQPRARRITGFHPVEIKMFHSPVPISFPKPLNRVPRHIRAVNNLFPVHDLSPLQSLQLCLIETSPNLESIFANSKPELRLLRNQQKIECIVSVGNGLNDPLLRVRVRSQLSRVMGRKN